MPPSQQHISFELPIWLIEFQSEWVNTLSDEKKMNFVLEAARNNVLNKTGGPFAAAIVDCVSGELLALGVNLVTNTNNAILHAEVVAIMLAQNKLKTYDLGKEGLHQHELISSSEPCAMCVGATHWSGVQRLVYAACVEDAQAIGFDEGPISPTWKQEFMQRDIDIIPELNRDAAIEILKLYKNSGGVLY